MVDIGIAAHCWLAERFDKGVDATSGPLIQLLFDTLSSLHFVTRSLPLEWTSTSAAITSGAIHALYWKLPRDPHQLVPLRSSITLAGDLSEILNALLGRQLLELKEPLVLLSESVKPFRSVRNFFVHLEERLSNPDRHGITGSKSTGCGIAYTPAARGCLHVILQGNQLHFTNYGNVEVVDIGRAAFNSIFEKSRDVYATLIAHKLHAHLYSYKSPSSLYPL